MNPQTPEVPQKHHDHYATIGLWYLTYFIFVWDNELLNYNINSHDDIVPDLEALFQTLVLRPLLLQPLWCFHYAYP